MLSCGPWFCATARDSLTYAPQADTVGYTYIPMSQQEIDSEQEMVRQVTGEDIDLLDKIIKYLDESKIDRSAEKKIDFTIIGGPAYSKRTSLMGAVLAAGIYRTDRNDLLSQPSNVMLIAKVSITGYYYVGIAGNTFFKQGRHRLDYDVGAQSEPSDFWGLGYSAAMNNSVTRFTLKKYTVVAKYRYELMRNLYAGALVDFNSSYAKKLDVPHYLDGQRLRYTAAGAGPILEYDSRDAVTAPHRGMYIGIDAMIRPKALGDCGHTLWRVRATADFFQPLWRGGVLAADLYGEFNSQHTPWSMYALLGDNFRMRGYYEGRFNDRNMIAAQLELRQNIWRRIGCTVWGGAGNVFRSFDDFRWEQTLPNWGIGLRWELKQRMNIRIDYGFGCKIKGRLVNGFIMSINEAF